ncbi:MAG: DNA polymerase III subunit gamma/tau [Firmicutes bacterium]|nr:DNA polymerase III subunit gamma/tau [Alicyclobacillaceae bacterium]MCL6496036.1 DNA polymerase III subunit gamma/tau [Bacillota bacterium]
MARQALYRRYRPQRFAEVVGQERTVDILRAAVAQGRLTHAYLFSGPRGTGKTSVARILAQAANCAHPVGGEPCGACPSCQAAEAGRHLDIVEIDAASNRGIDEIRDLKERLAHQPVQGSTKVYIIDEVHMLSADAFNALLKTLEEPPPHVLFILATTEPQKLPVTVVSRCQRYEFHRLSPVQIAEQLARVLTQEGVAFEPEALEVLAEAADGALRDALSLADQVVGAVEPLTAEAVRPLVGSLDRGRLGRLWEAVTGPSPAAVAQALEAAYHEGAEVRLVLREMAQLLRDVMVWREVGPEAFPPYRRRWLGPWAERLRPDLDAEAWLLALETLAEAEGRLRGGFPPLLVAELALFWVQRRIGAQASAPQAEVPSLAAERAEPRAQAAEPPQEPEPAGPLAPRWPEVMQRVRERRWLYVLLQQARVEEAPDGLVLCFPFEGLKARLQRSDLKPVFEEALRQVYGPAVRYRVTTGPAAKPAASEDRAEVKRRIRQMLGDEVRLIGFEE